jgi:uncharacterized peroxidase-related enzyme
MFLSDAPVTSAVADAWQKDLHAEGFVMNQARLWAWRDDVRLAFLNARRTLLSGSSLSPREVAVIVCAMASTLGDSYCSIAWGAKLTDLSQASAAAAVLQGQPSSSLSDRELAIATWVRKVVGTPNSTTALDIDMLRQAGLNDREIFEATVLTAFRLAFSVVNDALGALPDRELWAKLPDELKSIIAYGREVAKT